jgi:hypothetical protein
MLRPAAVSSCCVLLLPSLPFSGNFLDLLHVRQSIFVALKKG